MPCRWKPRPQCILHRHSKILITNGQFLFPWAGQEKFNYAARIASWFHHFSAYERPVHCTMQAMQATLNMHATYSSSAGRSWCVMLGQWIWVDGQIRVGLIEFSPKNSNSPDSRLQCARRSSSHDSTDYILRVQYCITPSVLGRWSDQGKMDLRDARNGDLQWQHCTKARS